jgi:hypothetical protein
MSLLTLVIVIILVGVALWAVNTYLPMDPKIKQLLNVLVVIVAVIVVIVFLLNLLGYSTGADLRLH